jgi:AraC-like DNA-binding protein
MTKNEIEENIDHIDFPLDWNDPSYRIISKTRRTVSEKFRIELKPYFLGVNQVAVDASVNHPPHRHSGFELIVVKSGPYRCKLNGERITLGSTDCLLIKPGDLHEVELKAGQRHYVLQFDLAEQTTNTDRKVFFLSRRITNKQQAFPVPISEVEPLLEAIALQSKLKHRFAAEIQDCLVENLLWMLLSYIPEKRLAPAFRKISDDQYFLDKLGRMAQKYSNQHLSLDELAKRMEVSKSTLSKRCNDLLGESPSQYLMRCKIDKAVHLLSSTKSAIKGISFELGFQNPYHFSRVFKRFTGHAPSEYRSDSFND